MPANTAPKETRPAGENFVWLTAMGLATGLVMVIGLLALVIFNGLSVFWPAPVYQVTLAPDAPGGPIEGRVFAASVAERREKLSRNEAGGFDQEIKFFIGNKDVYQQMFLFQDTSAVASMELPPDIMVAERTRNGNGIFMPVSFVADDGTEILADAPEFEKALRAEMQASQARLDLYEDKAQGPIAKLSNQIKENTLEQRILIEKYAQASPDLRTMDSLHRDHLVGRLNEAQIRDYQALAGRGNEYATLAALHAQQHELQAEVESFTSQTQALLDANQIAQLKYRLLSGEERSMPVGELLHYWRPNELNFFEKIGYFFSHIWTFLSEKPRSANTEGGVFPAIFGTFVMTVLMSAAVMPFGVLAAIYLREYARQGAFTQSIRIAVNNLAGVPSIVYGVFGLGFFVYTVGGGIDQLFFSDRLLINEPTFGTGGVLWASLTLALMTVPVVVVATEEALAAVPRGMREASLACGASKWQTIQRVVLPASASGILTGLILAMARGAGEVAPLMVVGVVKLAPDLPVDLSAPFVHLDRKFMHLGFHIYDLGFQSPDSEAAKPMVFATTLLLILLVVLLNLGAILIRNHLRRKYSTSAF
jgi:phosphate transport system permease protein